MNATPVSIANLGDLVFKVRGEAGGVLGPITAESRFMADLGLDSLQVIGLVFLWEKQYGISMSQHEELLANLHTVGQAVEAIRALQTACLER